MEPNEVTSQIVDAAWQIHTSKTGGKHRAETQRARRKPGAMGIGKLFLIIFQIFLARIYGRT
jgi:hypothetical protein